MNIVLVNIRTSYIMSIPFGITYLGAVLVENNHKVKLFDIYPYDNVEIVIEEIKNSFSPDLIGFSVMTTNFFRAKKLCSIFKKHFSQAKFCAGGIHPTVRPKETIDEMDLDFVVLGEGERVLVKACSAIENSQSLKGLKGIAFKEASEIYINKELDIVENLDSLPFPARELLPISRYLIPPGYIRSNFLNRTLSVYTSRGCPASCTFCNSSSIFHKRIRRRSVRNVIDEITHLIKCYKVDGIYFHDETFTMQPEWVKNLCKELKPFGLLWGCQTRVSLINDELLSIMKSAGCLQIDFGVESASDRMLKLIKKAQTAEQVKRALELTRKHGIKSFASFMVGLPGETEEDLKKNIEFLRKIKPDFTYFNLFTPFPGTEAAETAIREGKMPVDYFSKNYDMLLETSPLINLSAVSTKTVMRYHRKLRNMVLLRNYLGVITRKNFKIIIKAIGFFLLSPGVMLKAIRELIQTRNIEKFIFLIFSNYQYCMSKKDIA